MPLFEDEVSLGDEEFTVPEDPVEQERFKCRLISTLKSLKKKQRSDGKNHRYSLFSSELIGGYYGHNGR